MPTPPGSEVREYNAHIREVLEISQRMIELADRGDRDRQDPSCGVMFGVLRDAGYRLQELAREEIEVHRKAGIWNED